MSYSIQPMGDLAIRISFGEQISESIHIEIQEFITRLKVRQIPGIVEWVPTYTAITIFYVPEVIDYSTLIMEVKRIANAQKNVQRRQPTIYEIPVYYGGETGPDLSYIADYHHITEEEVISLHSNKEYLIYMMGFVPGFPYLGGLSERLAVPRLEHPRANVPPGAVGIGGMQTGIYPSQVPSGWRIIGITPVTLFDIKKAPPILLSAGNYIKFFPIDFEEYVRIKNLENYKVSIYKKRG